MIWQKYSMSNPPPKDRWIVFAWSLRGGSVHAARWRSWGCWEDVEGVAWEDDDLAGSFWLALPDLPAPAEKEDARS